MLQYTHSLHWQSSGLTSPLITVALACSLMIRRIRGYGILTIQYSTECVLGYHTCTSSTADILQNYQAPAVLFFGHSIPATYEHVQILNIQKDQYGTAGMGSL